MLTGLHQAYSSVLESCCFGELDAHSLVESVQLIPLLRLEEMEARGGAPWRQGPAHPIRGRSSSSVELSYLLYLQRSRASSETCSLLIVDCAAGCGFGELLLFTRCPSRWRLHVWQQPGSEKRVQGLKTDIPLGAMSDRVNAVT